LLIVIIGIVAFFINQTHPCTATVLVYLVNTRLNKQQITVPNDKIIRLEKKKNSSGMAVWNLGSGSTQIREASQNLAPLPLFS